MFGKVGRCAFEEVVVVELLKIKCLPVLFYSLESCLFNKSQIRSLAFAISGAFSKIFSIKQDLIDNCRMLFNCQFVADSLSRTKKIFLRKFINSHLQFI